MPAVASGKKVLVAAHGNSLRSMIMKLENMSGEEIVNTELSTGVPIVYRLDKDGQSNFSSPRRLVRRNGYAYALLGSPDIRQGPLKGGSQPRLDWLFNTSRATIPGSRVSWSV